MTVQLSTIEFQLMVAYMNNEKIFDKYLSPEGLLVIESIDKYERSYGTKPGISWLENYCSQVRPDKFLSVDYLNKELVNSFLTKQIQNQCYVSGNLSPVDPYKAFQQLSDFCSETTQLILNDQIDKIIKFSDYQERLKSSTDQNAAPIFRTRAKFGLPSIDANTEGMCDGDLILIIGQTNQGKSWLSRKIALNAAIDDKVNVLLMPFEESGTASMHTIDAIYGKISAKRYMNRSLDAHEKMKLYQKFSELGDKPHGDIIIPNITKIRRGSVTDIMKLVRQYDSDVIIIDQLTLISKSLNWEDMGNMSKELKVAAMLAERPILLLAQATKNAKHVMEVGYECIAHAEEIVRNADTAIYVAPDKDSTEIGVKYFKLLKTRRGVKDIVTKNHWDLNFSTIEELNSVDPNDYDFIRSSSTQSNQPSPHKKPMVNGFSRSGNFRS